MPHCLERPKSSAANNIWDTAQTEGGGDIHFAVFGASRRGRGLAPFWCCLTFCLLMRLDVVVYSPRHYICCVIAGADLCGGIGCSTAQSWQPFVRQSARRLAEPDKLRLSWQGGVLFLAFWSFFRVCAGMAKMWLMETEGAEETKSLFFKLWRWRYAEEVSNGSGGEGWLDSSRASNKTTTAYLMRSRF